MIIQAIMKIITVLHLSHPKLCVILFFCCKNVNLSKNLANKDGINYMEIIINHLIFIVWRIIIKVGGSAMSI